MSSILVVEDEPDLASLIAFNLKQAKFEVEVAYNGETALDIAGVRRPHLVVLDLMLPDISGVEVCRELKRSTNTSYVPVLMLTAKKEEADRVAGFEAGADDYIVKPFSVLELVLRVKAVLRRAGTWEADPKSLAVGLIEVDVVEHRCTVAGQSIPLTLLEFRLLHYLMTRLGRVQPREQLLQDVWKVQSTLETRTIDTHINRLRQKLGAARDYLETVRGIGYRLINPDRLPADQSRRQPVAMGTAQRDGRQREPSSTIVLGGRAPEGSAGGRGRRAALCLALDSSWGGGLAPCPPAIEHSTNSTSQGLQ